MKVFEDAESLRERLGAPALAVGNFDGLHVGHARVLQVLRERATAIGAPSAVMTFRPHPALVLGGREAPPRLISDAQREELLGAWGLDALLLQRFDASLAALSPTDFVQQVLCGALAARVVVVGEGFRFGRGRAGDVVELGALLGERGATAIGVPRVTHGGEVVSATRIRRLVADGADEEASELLGRPLVLEASVVPGDGRGRQLGFPTANLHAPGSVVPGHGVHACVVGRGEDTWPAVCNVGVRPTFRGDRACIEVHVLGEPGNLYGQVLRVAFLGKLRDERRFDGPGALARQIREDAARAQERLAGVRLQGLRGPGF